MHEPGSPPWLWLAGGIPMCAVRLTLIALLASAHAWAGPTGAQERQPVGTERTQIKVLGRSVFSARASVEAPPRGSADSHPTCSSHFRLWGTLTEDAGHPIAEAEVRARLFSPSGGPMAAGEPVPCAGFWPGVRVESDGYSLRTDRVGAFCLGACMPRDQIVARVAFTGEAFYAAASAEVRIDAGRGMLALAFEPEPQIIDLDLPTVPLSIHVIGLLESERRRARVNLLDDGRTVLGQFEIDADAMARGALPIEKMGSAGVGPLHAVLVGDRLPSVPTATCYVERRARVEIEILQARPLRFGSGSAVTAAARWARGAVNTGVIEAVHRGTVISASALGPTGTALLVIDPDVDDPNEPIPVVLRYVPAAPFWTPGSPRTVDLPARSHVGVRTWALLLATLLVGAWLLRSAVAPMSWQRKPRTRSPRPVVPNHTPDPRKATTPHSIWSGRVVDAHEGIPIVGAAVAIVAPSFPSPSRSDAPSPLPQSGQSVLVHATTDIDGHFDLRVDQPPEGTRLEVRARWHTHASQLAPGGTDLVVPLRKRKRVLLERLVGWALRQPERFLPHRDPTPGEIACAWQARASTHDGRPTGPADVAAWAHAVQTAAFGPDPIDEAAEERINSLEPRPNR